MRTWNYYFVTFGCKVNQYETQSLREAWDACGGRECDSPADADLACINSCAITAKGERDARNAFFRLRREAPQARILVTGCAARLLQDALAACDAAPDAVVFQEQKAILLQDPWQVLRSQTEEHVVPQRFPAFEISAFRRARPVLKVQDGCQHRCTYCIVPLTRGRCHSRSPQETLAEARRLLEAGYTEIMISGINLRQYGRDTPEFGDFWALLESLDRELAPEFSGKARFRISSLEPSQLDERGVATLAGCRMVCPHLHISLQHASQQVLKRMGRGHYTFAMLEEGLKQIQQHWPRLGLGADLLVGFPGETESDIQVLLEAMQRIPLSYAHVFPYSVRPGTAAARFAEQLPNAIKHERAAQIREAVAQQQERFWQEQMTLERMTLVCDVGAGVKAGRKGINEYYVPCFLTAGVQHQERTLMTVRPVALTPKGIEVAPL